MKTCLKCDLKAKDSDVECANCASRFSYVSDEPDPDYESHLDLIENPLPSPPPPIKVETSTWTKIIALSLVVLVLMFGWQQYSASKLSECQAKALELQSGAFAKILDARFDGQNCEFLVQPPDLGLGLTQQANWVDEEFFIILYRKQN